MLATHLDVPRSRHECRYSGMGRSHHSLAPTKGDRAPVRGPCVPIRPLATQSGRCTVACYSPRPQPSGARYQYFTPTSYLSNFRAVPGMSPDPSIPDDPHELEALAAARLDPAALEYFARGSGDGVTLAENRAAWRRLRLR